LQVHGDSAKIGICHEDDPACEELVWVAVGESMEVDGKRWKLVSVHGMGDIPQGAPRGPALGGWPQ